MNATTNRDGAPPERSDRHTRRSYGWILEAFLIITVTPALVAGVLSLNNLPVA